MEIGKHLKSLELNYALGHLTSVPVHVDAVSVHIHHSRTVNLCHVGVKLVVENKVYPGDVEGKLRLPLPSGATVCGFSVGDRHAVAVRAAKANSIRYLEKEGGWAVATASHVDSDTWETAVYPLPFGVPKTLEVRFVCPPADDARFFWPLTFATPVRVITVHPTEDAHHNATLPGGIDICLRADRDNAVSPPLAAVHTVDPDENGLLYWSARLTADAVEDAFRPIVQAAAVPCGAPKAVGAVAVIVDVSRGRRLEADTDVERIRALGRAFPKGTAFGLWAYNRALLRLVSRGTGEEAADALAMQHYDGAPCEAHMQAAIAEATHGGFDAVVWISNGHPLATTTDAVLNAPPVLSAAPAHPTAQWLARQSGGGIGPPNCDAFAAYAAVERHKSTHVSGLGFRFGDSSQERTAAIDSELHDSSQERTAAIDSELHASSQERTAAIDSELHISEEIWMDERIESVPDFRLRPCRHALQADGSVRLHGICTPDTLPTEIVVKLSRGGVDALVHVALAASVAVGDAASAEARLLQVSYAAAAASQARTEQPDHGVGEELAAQLEVRAGIATASTTLLILHTADQFVAHGLTCPPDDALHAEWKALRDAHDAQRAQREEEARALCTQKLDGPMAALAARFGSASSRPPVPSVNEPMHVESAESVAAMRSMPGPPASPVIQENDGSPDSSVVQENDDGPDNYRSLGEAACADAAPVYRGASGPEHEEDCAPQTGGDARAAADDGAGEKRLRAVVRDGTPMPTPSKRSKTGEENHANLLLTVPDLPVITGQAWIADLEKAFEGGGLAALWRLYDARIATHQKGGTDFDPATFFSFASALEKHGADRHDVFNALFNVSVLRPGDTQACRSAAYHLVEAGDHRGALELLRRVKDVLSPEEPNSYLDVALVAFFELRTSATETDHETAIDEITSCLAHVIRHIAWPHRYLEIEWPALILLSWVCDWTLHKHGRDPWPIDLPASLRLGDGGGVKLDLFVWLGWDTDKTDVDLHVTEPSGETVYYSHPRSTSTGAMLSRDFTQGYGPEVYTLTNAPAGTYRIIAKYFSCNQGTNLTGATSAIVWSVKHMGNYDAEVFSFKSTRLVENKQLHAVDAIQI